MIMIGQRNVAINESRFGGYCIGHLIAVAVSTYSYFGIYSEQGSCMRFPINSIQEKNIRKVLESPQNERGKITYLRAVADKLAESQGMYEVH